MTLPCFYLLLLWWAQGVQEVRGLLLRVLKWKLILATVWGRVLIAALDVFVLTGVIFARFYQSATYNS